MLPLSDQLPAKRNFFRSLFEAVGFRGDHDLTAGCTKGQKHASFASRNNDVGILGVRKEPSVSLS
jgi:hypothetical protein